MPKVFGFAGFSGAGKTTLLEKVIPHFTSQGFKVSVIKHAHHNFDIDQPGKDSYRHRAAGAQEVLLTAGKRWVLMHELRDEPEPTLEQQIKRLSHCDIVVVEGFKRSAIPKIEVWRKDNDKPLLHPQDSHIQAIATDCALPDCPVP
ncbi:MAG: molybdopterin-guanine dinucleotide biosynthesis protein B, partial [Limnobacter sp.]|nr:molybdopterin-guanine dinucleotide biosynthesis protein B [Limnobacter sp.]